MPFDDYGMYTTTKPNAAPEPPPGGISVRTEPYAFINFHYMKDDISLFGEDNQPTVVIKNVPNWVKDTESGRIPYIPVMNPTDANKVIRYSQNHVEAQVWAGMGIITLTGVAATIGWLIWPPLAFILGITAATIGLYNAKKKHILNTTSYTRSKEIYNKSRPILYEIERKGLTTWLKNKYSIEIDNKTLDKLYGNIWEAYGIKELVPFTDTTGKKWTLAKEENKAGWTVKQTPAEV
jgi:hypothetical protein